MAFSKGCYLLGAVLLLVLQSSNAMKLLKENGLEDTPCDWPTGQQYWPHPTNCRMFVQCTPYGPQGMQCAPGTAWAQSLLTCDFEANTDCGKHQPTSPPKAPSTLPPKVPSTSQPKAPSTSPPKAPSTLPPKVPSTSLPKSPSTSAPKSPSTATPPENKVTCPSPYELRGDECFFVSEDANDLLDWDESRQRCLSMGGDLAQPQNMVDFVAYIEESYPNSKSTIWLGATDREVEQEWNWVSGEPVPPAMWKPWPHNQPSGDGNCMEIHWWPKTGFYMNDWFCTRKGYFACEFTAPLPENTDLHEVSFVNSGGIAKATSTHPQHTPMDAFGAPNRPWHWHTYDPWTLPVSIWFEFPEPIKVVKYSFVSRPDMPYTALDGPSKYIFWASNDTDCSDDSSRVTLYEDNSGTPFQAANEPKSESIDNEQFFRCYGFKVTEVPGRSSGRKIVTIGKVRYWE